LDSFPSESPPSDVSLLPEFLLISAPTFVWGDIDEESFVHSMCCCYDEVIHWRKVLFKLPSGKSGRAFVSEVCRLFNANANGAALECVALNAVMIMLVLLLQKPYHRSKNHENIVQLTCRLAAWCSGDIDTLVQEGRVLQGNLRSRFTRNHRTEYNIPQRFSNFMESRMLCVYYQKTIVVGH